MDVVDGPRIEARDERPTIGIRRRVPFRGMLAARDRLLSELVAWFASREVELAGPFFLRLHTVDMGGVMDIEVGSFVDDHALDDLGFGLVADGDGDPDDEHDPDAVTDADAHADPEADACAAAGTMPAGRYVTLTYRNHSMRANRLLLGWAAEQSVEFDVIPSADGDEWTGRFEIYLTDPRTEPRKTRWTTQLAFLTR